MDGHLSGTDVAAGLVRSTRGVAGGPPCLCSTLLRMGFTEPTRSPGSLVVSYTTLSPLPVPCGHRRSALCCTSRRVARLGVTQHPALRSPDFPRPQFLRAAAVFRAHHRNGSGALSVPGPRRSEVDEGPSIASEHRAAFLDRRSLTGARAARREAAGAGKAVRSLSGDIGLSAGAANAKRAGAGTRAATILAAGAYRRSSIDAASIGEHASRGAKHGGHEAEYRQLERVWAGGRQQRNDPDKEEDQ